jgi:hypothetical protein
MVAPIGNAPEVLPPDAMRINVAVGRRTVTKRVTNFHHI